MSNPGHQLLKKRLQLLNVTNLVHQFPTFLHRLLVHDPWLVMGVEVVVVWLEGVLHHSDDPSAFLQVPCHDVPSRLRSARAAGETGRGRARVRETEPPPGEWWSPTPPPARTASERRIRATVRRRGVEGNGGYLLKDPIGGIKRRVNVQVVAPAQAHWLTACAPGEGALLSAGSRLISGAPAPSLLTRSAGGQWHLFSVQTSRRGLECVLSLVLTTHDVVPFFFESPAAALDACALRLWREVQWLCDSEARSRLTRWLRGSSLQTAIASRSQTGTGTNK